MNHDRRRDVGIGLMAMVIFHLVSATSGNVALGDGFGWDGRGYALMVTDGLRAGPPNMQLRPLLILVTGIPYALGVDLLESFRLLNYVYAFSLYFFVARLLAHRGVDTRLRAVIAANLALCIATSRMFAFYPSQIDLGALAVITAAFYFVSTDQRVAAAIGCVLAAASREFGIAVALYGIHRAIRQRRPWTEIAAMYLPGLATAVAIRLAMMTTATAAARPLSIGDALDNLRLWRTLEFPTVFVYFALVVFGGISALLVLRAGRVLSRLRAESELVTFLIIVVSLSAAGSLDIWRYLVFALPAAVALMADDVAGLDRRHAMVVVTCMTAITVITQQPFGFMDETIYFRQWFPLYVSRPFPADLVQEWAARLGALFLVLTATWFALRRVRVPVAGISRG